MEVRSYDIDGVITKGIKPEPSCIIVSGRLSTFMAETRDLLNKLGISEAIPVYLRPAGISDDRVSAGVWKATIINWARVTEHWEDDPLQANIISAMCNVKIVMVK